MKLTIFFILGLFSSSIFAGTPSYSYEKAGITFNHDGLELNSTPSNRNSLSVAFSSGKEPFTVSLLFQENRFKGSLEAFIKKEEENNKKGGYSNEISIKKITNASNASGYEIIRDSKFIKIRRFIFQSKKDNKLYSFTLMEDASLKDENAQAIRGYETMKATLELSK